MMELDLAGQLCSKAEPNEKANAFLKLWGWAWLVIVAVTIMMTPFGARAQMAGTGAISGTVTDASGAVIPNATVTAIAVDTNVKTVRSSTGAGDYNITPLTPGVYTVIVTAPGFEKFVQENVTVDALTTVAVNIKLAVGATSQTVTVTSAPPVLETTDATIGAVMDNQMYSSLPLLMGASGNADQRRATDFAYLMPGVQNTYAASSTSNPTSASGAVNGGNPNGGTSEIYIDGVNLPEADGIGDPRFMWTAFGVDAIDQFQVQTFGFSTQYAGQGVQNYSIKQGTNQIHGSIYEYIRNTELDAWKPNAKTPTLTGAPVPTGGVCSSAALSASTSWCALGGIKSKEIMNEVGMAISGPIIKNKLFMFYNYGQYRNQNGPSPKLQTIPTAPMLGYSATGAALGYADYSGYAVYNGKAGCQIGSTSNYCYDIYDPGTQTVPNCSGANCQRTVFSNDQIPAARISAAAAYINKYMLPYEAITNQALYSNNIVTGYNSGLSNWYQSGRLDFDQSDKNQISLIIAFGRQASTGPNASGAANALGPPFNSSQSYTPKTNVDILKDTWTINAHLVNQASVAYGRYKSLSVTPSDSPQYAASQTGLLNTPVGQASYFPGIAFSGGADAPTTEANYDENQKVNNTYTAADNVQWQHGRHSVTVGGQVVEVQFNYIKNLTYSSPMTYTFAAAQTEGYSSTGSALTTGSSYASYMLGAVSSSSVSVGLPGFGSRWLDPSFWGQDDYKVTSKLTMNIGMRWDIFPSIHETHDLFTWLNPIGANTNSGNLGTLEFAGSGTGNYYSGVHNPASAWYKNLAPRLGVAYAVNSKTVIRASYGLNFARGDWTSGSQSGTPSSTGLAPSASAAGGLSNAPSFYWDGTQCKNGVAQDGFTLCGWTGSIAPPSSVLPSGATMAEFGAVETATLKNANNATITYFDPYLGSRTPEYLNWTFGVERQITRDMTVSVSYVGSEGHFLSVSNAMYTRNNKLPESIAALAGYTLTSSGGSTQAPCSGATCLYPVLTQKSSTQSLETAYLAMAQTDGFTPPNPFASAANFYDGNAVYQYYLNFPQYSAVSDTTSFVGNENWNALEISVRQRPSHGLNWMFNYTYSKSIDDLGTFRVYDNTRLDRALSTASQPQNITSTVVYQLPLGRGHMWGDNWLYREVASDWTISGIGLAHSGLPVLVTGSGCGGSSILNTCMPNVVSGQAGRQYTYGKTSTGTKVNWDPSSSNYIGLQQYINPAAFTVNIAGTCAATGTGAYQTYTGQAYNICNGPALYVPGNAPRTAALNSWAQRYMDADLALRRTFPIYREWKLAFELDMTNIANHVVYPAPSASVSSTPASFGTITGVSNYPRDVQGALRISW